MRDILVEVEKERERQRQYDEADWGELARHAANNELDSSAVSRLSELLTSLNRHPDAFTADMTTVRERQRLAGLTEDYDARSADFQKKIAAAKARKEAAVAAQKSAHADLVDLNTHRRLLDLAKVQHDRLVQSRPDLFDEVSL